MQKHRLTFNIYPMIILIIITIIQNSWHMSLLPTAQAWGLVLMLIIKMICLAVLVTTLKIKDLNE